jgi:hypothetical protein
MEGLVFEGSLIASMRWRRTTQRLALGFAFQSSARLFSAARCRVEVGPNTTFECRSVRCKTSRYAHTILRLFFRYIAIAAMPQNHIAVQTLRIEMILLRFT